MTLIVSLCFFKKRFWENRYLILFIGGCVALVATLIINLSVRNGLPTKVMVSGKKPLYTFYVPDSLITTNITFDEQKLASLDSTIYGTITQSNFVKDFDYYAMDVTHFLKDTAKKQIPVRVLLYTKTKTDDDIRVGVFKRANKQDYHLLKNLYLAPSPADSISYMCEKRLEYDVVDNKWVSVLGLPTISRYTVIYVPPTEFAMIPDSLIRKLPF